MKSICVYCGSNMGSRPGYRGAAAELGRQLAQEGIRLVYGGANRGLMQVLADAVLEEGGQALGIIPKSIVDAGIAHEGLTELRVVGSLHERKTLMSNLSDGFIAMPGGYGTFEEFLEVLTWAQLGLHTKPCGLLNVEGFYDSLLKFIDHATSQGFMPMAHRNLILVDGTPKTLIARMRSYKPSANTPKWLDEG